MSMRLVVSSCMVLALGGLAWAEKKSYTLADLAALEKSGSWNELVDHLEDVSPSKRQAKWKKLVESAAINYMKSQKVDRNPLGALIGADHFTKRYPWLTGFKGFMAVRAELGIKGFAACFKQRYHNCHGRLLPFVEADKGNVKLALKAAKLSTRRGNKSFAIPFFNLAARWTKKNKLAKFCADTDLLDESMFEALNQPKSAKVLKPALAVAKTCWKIMKPDLIIHVDTDGQYYRTNTCPLLLKRKVLSAAQSAKCRKAR